MSSALASAPIPPPFVLQRLRSRLLLNAAQAVFRGSVLRVVTILLGSPVLIAYGLVFEVPWPFYALLPLYFLGFVLLPGSLGGLACLLVVNLVPRHRRQVLVVAILLVVLLLIGWSIHLAHVAKSES